MSISGTAITQLICASCVLAYSKGRFSHDVAHLRNHRHSVMVNESLDFENKLNKISNSI